MVSGSSSRLSEQPGLRSSPLAQRVASLRYRLEALGELKPLLGLPVAEDLAPRQWAVIEAQLGAAQARLSTRLTRALRASGALAGGADRELSAVVGNLELELAKAYVLFDTYMDVLTQRLSPQLGAQLRGCDALAWDALERDHPALAFIERPLVFCDRGFGAAIMREGVRLPDGSLNPLPLIQVPYSRLREKHNLTSLYHEAGHEALMRLKLRRALAAATVEALGAAGASSVLAQLFASWMGELGPDFWTFCCTGVAQPGTLREILALPPEHAFRIVGGDPHPPPWLRTLFAFECARQQFGRGVWDAWEQQWRALYPLEAAPPETRALLEAAERLLVPAARVLFGTRFAALGRRRLPELFDFSGLDPSSRPRGAPALPRGRPGAQLAFFRWLREDGALAEEAQDRAMTRWLVALGKSTEVPIRRMGVEHA